MAFKKFGIRLKNFSKTKTGKKIIGVAKAIVKKECKKGEELNEEGDCVETFRASRNTRTRIPTIDILFLMVIILYVAYLFRK